MKSERECIAEDERIRGYRRCLHPAAIALLLLFQASPALTQEAGKTIAAVDVKRLSLEDLGNIEITSVSKQAESLNDAPAAIYVITNEDIRRSGATSIPEILRLAPNLQVAQTTANVYSITARGFNSTTANKLLVLIDGRSVYTPLFSGVFWDVQDVVPDDIDRIEVISGPGGTLWGANAVNGVINIVTRNAKDTQGGLLTLGGGNIKRDGVVRYGGKFGENGAYRVYGKGFDNENTERADGTAVRDGWEKGQAGFRTDWAKDSDALTFQGDAFHGSEQQTLPSNTTLSGHNLLGRWTRKFSEESDLQVQVYYDHNRRSVPGNYLDNLDIYDLDVQHSFGVGSWNDVVVGGGYRSWSDDFAGSATTNFRPAKLTFNMGNVFAQDTMTLAPTLKLTFGLRLETNDYTDLSPLPSARLSWKATDSALLWSAISRAVRTPSRIDRDLFVPPVVTTSPNFDDEKLTAYEIGYRQQLSSRASFSISTFYNVYDDLRTLELSPPFTIVFGNMMEGHTYGVEAWGNYRVTDWWRLTAGLNVLRENLKLKSGSQDIGGIQGAGNDPKHQVSLRSSMNVTDSVEFDLGVRAIGGLPNPSVPSYVAVDARLGWNISDNADVSLNVTNSLDDSHPEFGAAPGRSVIERAFFVAFRGRF